MEDSSSKVVVELSPRNIWRVGWVVVALLAIGLLVNFLLDDGGSVLFTVLMSWFAAIAMEPAVSRLSRRMKRGFATMIVMISFLIFLILFVALFGKLFVDQITQVIVALPELAEEGIAWINNRFNANLDMNSIMESAGLGKENLTSIAANVGTNVLGLIVSILGSVFGLFTFGLFTFYLSADAPRFRTWIVALFPRSYQHVAINTWDITAAKTGAYVGARVVLAGINSATTAVVFFAIGMPYWLALALWTGIVAQFVPTIGTYIAIILPVIVGLLSPEPWIGIAALVWAILYQQVENLTIEPRISARAVNVHPAVAFGSVLLGAALFGVAGAFFAIPVTAMLLAMLGIYRTRYDVSEAAGLPASEAVADAEAVG